MGALVDDREKSDRFQLLNGSWKFRFYKSIYDLQEKFYEEETLTEAFDEIPVPGIWQNYGSAICTTGKSMWSIYS